jgi:hypothetical protein
VFSAQNPARYAFAEPATGGEAFIPKRGDYARSMAILREAASWYGAEVMSGGAQWRGQRPVAYAAASDDSPSAVVGRRYGSTVVERQEVNVHAHTNTFSFSQTMDELAYRSAV